MERLYWNAFFILFRAPASKSNLNSVTSFLKQKHEVLLNRLGPTALVSTAQRLLEIQFEEVR
jgi:hypothetical protein